MGLFSLFGKKSKLVREVDGVWMTSAAKFQAVKAAAERHRSDSMVLVLAHFEQTRRDVSDAFSGAAGADDLSSEADLAGRLSRPAAGTVGIAAARCVPVLALESDPAGGCPITVLVAERYPLRTRDEAIASALEPLPWRTSLKFFLSLDDPLLARFGVEQIRGLLVQLGMSEKDEITNPTVNRAIERAQKKFAKQVRSDLNADSAEEWVRYNLG